MTNPLETLGKNQIRGSTKTPRNPSTNPDENEIELTTMIAEAGTSSETLESTAGDASP
jgi:hypothetical protein